MRKQENYNGFANYETWAVSLWLSNDYDSYRRYQSLASDVFACSASSASPCSSQQETAVLALAEALREELQDQSPVRDEASVYADLMHAALSEVDWHELAEHLLSESREE